MKKKDEVEEIFFILSLLTFPSCYLSSLERLHPASPLSAKFGHLMPLLPFHMNLLIKRKKGHSTNGFCYLFRHWHNKHHVKAREITEDGGNKMATKTQSEFSTAFYIAEWKNKWRMKKKIIILTIQRESRKEDVILKMFMCGLN